VGGVGEVESVAAVRSVSEGAVGGVTFDQGGLGGVGVIDDPAPGAAEEVKGSGGVALVETAEELEGGDEGGDAVWEFGSNWADGSPVLHELSCK